MIERLTEKDVRKALSAIRHAQPLDGSLMTLALVEARLRDEGIVVTPENARWALAALFDEIVGGELDRLRGEERVRDRAARTPEGERESLALDFRVGNPELEAWSMLYARYLSSAGIRMSELPEIVGVSTATINRRRRSAIGQLTWILHELERDASRLPEALPGAPASDRIVVDERAEDSGSGGAVAALLAAIRDDARVLRLSPRDLSAVVERPVSRLDDYRLGRVADLSRPQHRLDSRFVELSMLVDQGEMADSDRWRLDERRFTDLSALIDTMPDPAFVLLGPPGSGKSTLLRRLELDLAIAALRGESDALSLYVELSQYRPGRPGVLPPPPREWLGARWSRIYPRLPSLDDLLASVPMVLLLDAINEIPHTNDSDYRAQVAGWKHFVQEVVGGGSGNTVVLSCRSLEYGAPLSTPSLRVPQVRIEPLTDRQVERFLRVYSPGPAEALWRDLRGSPQLDLVRSPYFLKLLVDHMASERSLPGGRAALFTSFVRQAVRREVRRDNPLFQPDSLVTERDYRRIVSARRWRTPHELPTRGDLFPRLADLAYRMQESDALHESSQVRVDYDEALDLLAHDRGEDILSAGEALAVLDEDTDSDEVLFFHQLLQEYFAARRLAETPVPALVRVEWRADCQEPGLEEVLRSLGRADPLPPLPATRWEETTVMAAAMIADKDGFVKGIMEPSLALAGRCTAQPEVRGHLGQETVDRLAWALVERSRHPEADLRARISAAEALGDLGDPRFERRRGQHGDFLMPPLVDIPAGTYVIGSDVGYEAVGKTFDDQAPEHRVEIPRLAIGMFPVTRAEWQMFMDAGGYDDERWWDTEASRAWRRGEGTAAGDRQSNRYWTRQFAARPELLIELAGQGRMDDDDVDRWRRWMAMPDDELRTHLRDAFPDHRIIRPQRWSDEARGNPSRPVSGVCWYEARAYCAWLSAASGRSFRLPTEAEWEAAARGFEGRLYAYGDAWDPLRANILETHLQRLSPVGVFPAGDTPEGVADLCGNLAEWTSSCWGTDPERPDFVYPYRAGDGREEPEAPADCRRVQRGGTFVHSGVDSQCVFRARHHPAVQGGVMGLRVVADLPE